MIRTLMRDFSSFKNARNNITKHNIKHNERYMQKQDKYYRKHMKKNINNVKKIVPKMDTTYEVSNEPVSTNQFWQLFYFNLRRCINNAICSMFAHCLIVYFLNIMCYFFDVEINYNTSVTTMIGIKNNDDIAIYMIISVRILYMILV